MKNRIWSVMALGAVATGSVSAQQALMIECEGGITDAFSTEMIDSLSFSADGQQMQVFVSGKTATYQLQNVLGMTYGELPASLKVVYDEALTSIVNPYSLQGVKATIKGGNVTIDNSNVDTELAFQLSGTTANGSFTYNGSYKTTIELNGVNITNPKGAAIDIECGKRVTLALKKNTVSTLVDGEGGKQKAALYCKGHLEIDKTGTLNVTGNTKHAISAKEYIQLKKSEGTINILGAVSDGIHCSQYFLAGGFTVNIDNVQGDGIQAEVSGAEVYEEEYPDGSLHIQGGTFNINCPAADAVGLKADAGIVISDTKSVPVIKIVMSGEGAKGMSTLEGEIEVKAGEVSVTDSESAKAE